MHLSKEEIKEILREVIREELPKFLDAQPPFEIDINILPASKAYKILGFADARSLREAIADGTFRLNKEYQDYRKEGRTKPNYRFNIRACQKRIAQLSAQRGFIKNY